jgi:hypothetical protein
MRESIIEELLLLKDQAYKIEEGCCALLDQLSIMQETLTDCPDLDITACKALLPDIFQYCETMEDLNDQLSELEDPVQELLEQVQDITSTLAPDYDWLEARIKENRRQQSLGIPHAEG